MPKIQTFIQQHPVLTYFILTFALGWGVTLLLTGGLGPMFGPDWRSDPRFMFGLIAGPVAVAVAGLVMTGLTAGRIGYRDMRARLLQWRVQARWYGVALLSAPLVTIMTAMLLAWLLRSSEFLPTIFTTPDPGGLLLPGIATGLWVGFFEELGWTGFAVPGLRRRQGLLATGLLVGVVWGTLHFPLFRESDSFSGVLPLVLLLVKLFSWLPAYRVMMVWLYDRTGSLLVVMLMHMSLSATAMIFPPPATSDVESLTSILVSAAIWWLLVAVVLRWQTLHRPIRGVQTA